MANCKADVVQIPWLGNYPLSVATGEQAKWSGRKKTTTVQKALVFLYIFETAKACHPFERKEGQKEK